MVSVPPVTMMVPFSYCVSVALIVPPAGNGKVVAVPPMMVIAPETLLVFPAKLLATTRRVTTVPSAADGTVYVYW